LLAGCALKTGDAPPGLGFQTIDGHTKATRVFTGVRCIFRRSAGI